MSAPTITKLPNGNVKVTITGKYGDETSNTMTETQAAAFAYNLLTKGLPDNHLTKTLLGKAQG